MRFSRSPNWLTIGTNLLHNKHEYLLIPWEKPMATRRPIESFSTLSTHLTLGSGPRSHRKTCCRRPKPKTSNRSVGQQLTDNSHSLTDLFADDIEISEFSMSNNELPAIDFKLVYLSQTSTLRMHIRRVSNLPLQFRKNCSSYVKLSLITER